MKYKLLCIYLLISLFFYNNSNSQDFQWARQIGNQQTDEAESIEVDSNGNSYFIGVAQSYTYDLDPTPNGTKIINNTSTPFNPFRDIYLIKLNENGDFAWGKTFGDLKSGQYAYKIKIGQDGNIYLFLQTAELVPNLINSFITIIKISPDGVELSKIKIKNPGSFFTDSFDIDNQNNFLVSGWFVNSKTINFKNTDVKFESQNNIASYIFKLDNSGNFIWKKIFDTPQLSNVTIQTKPDGNIITVLNTSENSYPMCSILNINTNDATVIWEKKLSKQAINTFHLDRKQNIVIAGSNGVYQGPTDVDPSSNVVNTSSQKFLLWLDSNGNFIDLKEYFIEQFSADFRMWKIESDEQNNIFLVGDFAGKVDADPSPNDYFLENPYGKIQYGSGYAIKFDTNRNFENAYTLISDYRSLVKDIKVKKNSIYLLGDFNGECDFDPGTGNQIFDSLHNGGVLTSDGFVVKLSPCVPSKPVGDENQLFCSSKTATIGDLVPNFNGIKWYDNATNGSIIPITTTLQNGKTYYASNTLNNCETERLSVTVSIVNTPSNPIGNSNQIFCKNENAKISDIAITGQNIKWYDSSTSTVTLPNDKLLVNNTIYYASQTIGCESSRIPILIRIQDTPLPLAKSNQQFCIDENPLVSNVTISGTAIKWFDALTNGNLLDSSTSLQNGITYYASQTINGCESERTAVLINIQNTLTPIGNTNQTFCSNQNPTIAAIQVTGTDIKWYDASSNGSPIAASTNLINGTTYYASQTINNCESQRLGITVSIVNTPASPTANAFQSFCKNENATLSSIQISGQNIKWYDSSISTITLPNDRLLVNNTTYYASQTIGCESSRIPILIRIQDTPLPLAKSNQHFCIDDNPLLSNLTISGTTIKWYDTQVGGNLLSNTTTLQNGQTYFATQTINDCESERLAVTSIIQDSTPPTADAKQSFCIQKSAKISDISILGQSIQWFENLSSSISLPESTLLTNGITYYASQTVNNCESTRIPILITILDATNGECINLVDELPYPKFFTPNNDGFNDTWTIDFNYLEPNSPIRIFDRFGKLVKELRNYDSWDGTYLGQVLPATDYWFTVTRKNGSEFKSHFSLKR